MTQTTKDPGVEQREETKVASEHYVLGTPLRGKFEGYEMAMFGMGCFWGAEKKFWSLKGVHSTAVGYTAGSTPHPTYQEVCSSQTGHNEVVRVVFDPQVLSFTEILRTFWESHNPTQGMRQSNDRGTQYRSGIYVFSSVQAEQARSTRLDYEVLLKKAGFGAITTELLEAPTFYFAEDYHQQYLAKNPQGYCGLGGTGVSFA